MPKKVWHPLDGYSGNCESRGSHGDSEFVNIVFFQFCMFNLNLTYHNLRFTPMPNRCMEFLKSNLYSAVTKRLSTIS